MLISTDLRDSALPPAPTSGGSVSVASVTPAVQKASELAKKNLIRSATLSRKSPFAGMNPKEVTYDEGNLIGGGRKMDFAAVLAAMGKGAVEATDTAEPGSEEEKYAFHSSEPSFAN